MCAQSSLGLRLPYSLFPNLSGQLDHLAIARSVEAWESAHSRAQYYMQVGHPFSPARRNEMPALGAVIASEYASRRKASDFLPPFVAMNFSGHRGRSRQAGLSALQLRSVADRDEARHRIPDRCARESHLRPPLALA